MRNLALAVLAALTLGLFACVHEKAPLEPEQPPARVLPPDPGDSGRMTVEGIDSDGDGLRDDVQIFVDTTWSDSVTRTACVQLSKALQTFLLSDSSKTASLTAAVPLNQAIDCLYSLGPAVFGSLVEAVEAVVVNTEMRTRAYAGAGAYISGGSFPVSTVADNAASCKEAP